MYTVLINTEKFRLLSFDESLSRYKQFTIYEIQEFSYLGN